jgi:hypothetical protein
MTEYLPHGNYEGLAGILDMLYERVPEGPFRDAVVEARTALKGAAEADNGETERARLKIAQEALRIVRDFAEESRYDTFGPEDFLELLNHAQESLERGFASKEASRRGDRGFSGRGLSIAVALCLAV